MISICDPPADTDPGTLPPSPLERQVLRVLEHERPVEPTGLTRAHYLDLMERLIRTAAGWQDDRGAMIDPVLHEESGQTSPRFVAAGAVLMHFGRCHDLRQQVYLGMDYCCRRLAEGEAKSPDFWMRELMTAWWMLHESAPADRRAAWETHLRSIDPERTHWYVEKPDKPIASLHNWVVYGAAGEGLRQLAGLAHPDPAVNWGIRFWDKYMPAQLKHLSADGMYRDPGDPFTYDMTTRLQFATPLAFGLKTGIDAPLHELLRRGALAQLLYASPQGYVPFGGRSAMFHLQEAITAALGELEARRYRHANPRLASAFKRHAHLGVRAMSRWLEMTPHRHLKNGFDPQQMHGCEPYAAYGLYSCFAASCLGLAALFADDSIGESATPAEIGGYVVQFAPAFHKIFAVAGGTQIEIDTAADLHYDATGLGRFHRAGVPLELGLAMPFTSTPNYRVPEACLPPEPAAIGPAWRVGGRWRSLAGLSEGLTAALRVEHQSREEIRLRIDWRHGPQALTQSFTLTAGRLRIATHAPGAAAMRFTVPLLETDGQARSTVEQSPGRAVVRYRGATFTVCHQGEGSIGRAMANRNGIYHPLTLEARGAEMVVELSLESDPAAPAQEEGLGYSSPRREGCLTDERPREMDTRARVPRSAG